MSTDNESTANRFMRAHPELRSKIISSPEFQHWRNGFKQIDVDASKYYVAKGIPMVSGGDRLMDEDELMLEWARLSGLTKL